MEVPLSLNQLVNIHYPKVLINHRILNAPPPPPTPPPRGAHCPRDAEGLFPVRGGQGPAAAQGQFPPVARSSHRYTARATVTPRGPRLTLPYYWETGERRLLAPVPL